MKVLFIAPLYGRMKPQVSYSIVGDVNKEIHNLKDLGNKGDSDKYMAAIEKLRRENTQKRRSKRRFTVCCN